MQEIMTKAITKIFAVVYFTLIMNGAITSPDQIPGKVDKTDLQYLAGAAQIENGDNSEECIFLTCAVIMNRVHSDNWKGETIEKIITAKGQYASVTVNGFRTKQCSDRVLAIAKYTLLYYEPGLQCDADCVYQGQAINGHGKYIDGVLVHVYRKIDVPGQKPEYFCYE